MEVVTDRRYRFDVPPDELWAALTQLDRFQGWWPWLRHFDGVALAPAETWQCAVHPPLTYPVRFAVRIDDVRAPHGARATITGDVVGTARLDVESAGTGSEARLLARLAPGNGLLRFIGQVASPFVRRGHDWVLDSAARQFRDRAL